MIGTKDVREVTSALAREVVEGPGAEGWILNLGDTGVLGSLRSLTATQASAPGRTGSTVASHVAHVLFGFELLNRWSQGENPFTADYTESWHQREVNDQEWDSLRARLDAELRIWLESVSGTGALGSTELKGTIASVAHLAYHLGAIRQIAPDAKGPKAEASLTK